MEDYLLDRETLGKFVDELMKKRPLPVDTAEELNHYREEQMKALDDQIAHAIFDSLNEEQSSALNQLLDQESDNPDIFRNFFSEQNINVETVIADAAKSFSANFLANNTAAEQGGYNA